MWVGRSPVVASGDRHGFVSLRFGGKIRTRIVDVVEDGNSLPGVWEATENADCSLAACL